MIVTRSLSADLLGHVLARRLGCGHVITEHLGPRSRSFRPLRRHQRWLERMLRPRARAVAAVSAGQMDELVASGYRRDRHSVIPNGVATIRRYEAASSSAPSWACPATRSWP